MHTHSLATYMRGVRNGDWQDVANLMLLSANKLQKCGADFLICPDNTLHQAMDIVVRTSPLPWLHIAEVVAGLARERGFKRLGLTGTKYLVQSEVYPEKLNEVGVDYLRPGTTERDEIDRIIMDELVYGVFKPGSLAFFQRVIANFKEKACDAVVLGCTEIPLIVSDSNSPLPTLDSTRLLARAALQRALS
jgi:aspartate racemase